MTRHSPLQPFVTLAPFLLLQFSESVAPFNMSILAGAKLIIARKRILTAHPFSALQQLALYSNKTAFTDQINSQSERIEIQLGSAFLPEPKEILYQVKVANFVNLMGLVKTPVQYESGSKGKNLAVLVISQGDTDGNNSFVIPVVFEGDLARIVTIHVRKNDHVFVTGQLSQNPLPFPLSEELGKFHVVAENLNFVQGFKRTVCNKEMVGSFAGKTRTNKKKCGDETMNLWRDLVKNPLQWWDYRGHKTNGLVKENFPDLKHKVSGDGLWFDTAPDWVMSGLGKLEFDGKVMGSSNPGRNRNVDNSEDSWKKLVQSPGEWWDCRVGKWNPKSPDFKHKVTGDGLWIHSAPDWVLPGLENLEFNVKVTKPKPEYGSSSPFAKRNDSNRDDWWKKLIEKPGEWWDNRVGKRNPKAPDFKHKETGDGLWISSAPDWVRPQLETLDFIKPKPLSPQWSSSPSKRNDDS